MERSAKYTSPSTKLRNARRLTNHLKSKFKDMMQKPKPIMAFSPINSIEFKPSSIKSNKISKSSITFTNFPQPCRTCNQYQCQYDFKHKITFSIQGAVYDAMKAVEAKQPMKIPPNDV